MPPYTPARSGRAARGPLSALAFSLLAWPILLALTSCGDSAGPQPPTPVEEVQVSIPIAELELDALGATQDLTATTTRASRPVTAQLVWSTGDRSVVTAMQSGRLTARAVGRAWAYALSDSGGIDSVLVVVRQRVARVSVTPALRSRPLGRTWKFTATAFDAGGAPIPGTPVTWASLDPDIATVVGDGVATARALGVTTIRATADGVSSDAELRVTPTPPLHFVPDTIVVGVGQFPSGFSRPQPRIVADSADAEENVRAALTLTDPTVASVPAVISVPIRFDERLVSGLRTGTTRITAGASMYESAEAVIVVSTPRLILSEGTRDMRVPLGQPFYLSVTTADSLGAAHHLAAPLGVAARSSDPAVARATAPDVTAPVGDAGVRFVFQPMAAGTTRIVFSAAGYRGDSVDVTVVPASVQFLQFDWSPLHVRTIGVGQQLGTGAFVGASAIPIDAPVRVTLTQRHPERVRLGTTTITASDVLRRAPLDLFGLAAGSDTIVASADGLAPDTLVVHVTTPTYVVDQTPSLVHVASLGRAELHVADSTGGIHFPADGPVTVRVTSSDPRVIRPTSELVTIGQTTGGGGAWWSYVGLGTATLTFSDPAGIHVPVTRGPITVAPARLRMFFEQGRSRELSLGLRQSAGPLGWPEVAVDPYGFVPTTVRLRSSDPAIVRPATSDVAIEMTTAGSGRYDLVAGDQQGTAWIIGEVDGMITDSAAVVVGRPQLAVIGGGRQLVGNERFVTVQLQDQRGNLRSTSEPLTILLSTSVPDVVRLGRTAVTIPAGGFESEPISVEGRRAGTTLIRATDPRSAEPYRYDPGASSLITVTQP